MMRHNGIQYYQLPSGALMSIAGILDDIGGGIYDLLPGRLHNPHAVRRLPDNLNTDDPARTCPHCRTAYRASDQRDPDRCPYCWRLV